MAVVEANVPNPLPQEVFNLEIEVAHQYYVSETEVLAHNGIVCPLTNSTTDYSSELARSNNSARDALDRALGGFPGDEKDAHHVIPLELLAARGGTAY